jgi:hypothetical protein
MSPIEMIGVVGVTWLTCRGLDAYVLETRKWWHRKVRKDIVVCPSCEGLGSIINPDKENK